MASVDRSHVSSTPVPPKWNDEAEPLGHRADRGRHRHNLNEVSLSRDPDARHAERVGLMSETVCTDGVVALREWHPEDAQWYADSVRDSDIQRFTTDPPTLTADEVRTAIIALRSAEPPNDGSLPDVGLLICDATTGERLGNIAFAGHGAELSYWVALIPSRADIDGGKVAAMGDRIRAIEPRDVAAVVARAGAHPPRL